MLSPQLLYPVHEANLPLGISITHNSPPCAWLPFYYYCMTRKGVSSFFPIKMGLGRIPQRRWIFTCIADSAITAGL